LADRQDEIMNKQSDHARETLTQQRQYDDVRHDALLKRAEEELHQDTPSSVEHKARTNMVAHREDDHHSKATMLERSEEEIDKG
jgi:hypothetical protein